MIIWGHDSIFKNCSFPRVHGNDIQKDFFHAGPNYLANSVLR